MEMTTLTAEKCKIVEENNIFTVLTTLHSLFMKHVPIKKNIVKQLHGGNALILYQMADVRIISSI